MAKSQSIQVQLRNLKKWYFDKQKLFNDLPFQRKSGVWSPIVKSLFVRSVILDSYIPPLVFLRKEERDDDGNTLYSIEDGQQRLLTLFDFISDGEELSDSVNDYKGFALHASTPPVVMDGQEYQLSGLRFNELDQEVQNELLGHSFSVSVIEEYTQDEAEELFYLINSGVALSNIQKSKPKMGTENVNFFTRLLNGSFYTLNIAISKKQALSEDDLLTLIQASMLLDNEYNDREYSTIGAPAALKYAEEIRDNYSDTQKERLSKAVDFLNKAFSEEGQYKFFNKNNLPIVLVVAEIASDYPDDCTPDKFRDFIFNFAGETGRDVPIEYKLASREGNVKAFKVQQRLFVLYTALRKYLGVSFDERLPFSSSIDVEALENKIKEAVEEEQENIQTDITESDKGLTDSEEAFDESEESFDNE